MLVKRKIGFIGTGVMGRSMASHLLAEGYELFLYTRTKRKALALLSAGAHWCSSPIELVREVDVVFTMLGYPSDVEEVYFGDKGLFREVRRGKIFVDFTTSCPELAIRISARAKELFCHALDAPVSGGDKGAREANLSIMVGGEKHAYQEVFPLLDLLSKKLVWQGSAGAGQYAKLCNQIAIASGMLGVCEAMTFAKKAGLDPFVVLDSIEEGAAGSWSLSNLMPRALNGDYDAGFYIKHFIKDMGIAIDTSESLDLDLPGLSLAKELYAELSLSGASDLGTQALLAYYFKKNQIS